MCLVPFIGMQKKCSEINPPECSCYVQPVSRTDQFHMSYVQNAQGISRPSTKTAMTRKGQSLLRSDQAESQDGVLPDSGHALLTSALAADCMGGSVLKAQPE